MILREHLPSHRRLMALAPAGEMLMLGNQQKLAGFDFGRPYLTLDPDGGDIRLDLSDESFFARNPERDHLFERFAVVYNLGTIEHIWNIHQAYVNASRLLKVGGMFLNHAPVSGYEGHGVHVTEWVYLKKFFVLNGYVVKLSHFTKQTGEPCFAPTRGCGRNTIYWMAAEKVESVAKFQCPQQIFRDGRPVPDREEL